MSFFCIQSNSFIKSKRAATAAGFTAAILISTPVFAQTSEGTGGVYGSGAIGVVLADDQLIDGATTLGAPRRIITDMKSGTVAVLAIGYAANEAPWGRVRGEIEFARQNVKVKALSLNGVDRALIGEPSKKIDTGMLNLFYDSPAFIGPVRLELGVGFGRSRIDYNVRYNVSATGPSIEIPTNTSQGAYQLMAGLSARVSGGLELTSQFRYTKINDHKVERYNRTAGTLDSVLDAAYTSKTITLGLRYVF